MELTKIAGFALLLFLLGIYLYLKKSAKGPDFSKPESILKEVEIYMAYERKEAALQLLKKAIQVNTGHKGLVNKYSELSKNS